MRGYARLARHTRNSARTRNNNAHRIQQNRQRLVRQSSALYRSQIQNNPNLQATPMSATQLRELRTSISEKNGISVQPGKSVKSTAIDVGLDLLDVFKKIFPDDTDHHPHAVHEKAGRTATGLGLLTDVDGNVIHIDENDRPFIYDHEHNKAFVSIYQLPYDQNRKSCSIDSSGNALASVLMPVMSEWNKP